MQKELEMWKAENERHAEAIRKEERYKLAFSFYIAYIAVLLIPCSTHILNLLFSIWLISLQYNRTGVVSIEGTVGRTRGQDK